MNPELYNALKEGNIKALQELIIKGIDLKQTTKENQTPLLVAAAFGQIAMVDYLLDNGICQKGDKDKNDINALLEAAWHGQIPMVEHLLKNRHFDITVKSKSGKTALLMAVTNNKCEMVEYLLKNTTSTLTEQYNEGRTVLRYAATQGYTPIIKMLLSTFGMSILEKTDNGGDMVLASAAWNENNDIVRLLLKRGVYINFPVGGGKTTPLQTLEFNLRDDKEHKEISGIQLVKAANKLIIIAKDPTNSVAQAANLAGLGFKGSESDFSLDFTSDYTLDSTLDAILSILGENLNARNYPDGNTALHFAIKRKDKKLIIKLLQGGADINIPNKEGLTPALLLDMYFADEEARSFENSQFEDTYIDSLLAISKLKTINEEISEGKKELKEFKEVKEARETVKKDYKKEIEILKTKVMQNSKLLDIVTRNKLHIKLLPLVSYVDSPLFDKELAITLKQSIFESLEDLNKYNREKISLRLYDLISNPGSAIYDESVFNKIIQFIHPRMSKKSTSEIKEFLDSDFKESHFLFCKDTLEDDKDKNLYQVITNVCWLRVPPITVAYAFDMTPSDQFKLWDVDRPFGTLEALGQFLVTRLKKEVTEKKRKIEAEIQNMDIKRISESRESSMRVLTGGQLGIMEALRKQYDEKLQKMGGREKVLEEFKAYLETMFLKSAPEYNGKKLPLHYDKELDNKETRELYYTNPFHTAWRYLLNPNPWINPNAPYAAKTEGVATHADITEQARTDLAYLWLAASDSSIVPIRDMTLEAMMENFAFEVAYINRGHNWDELDAIKDGDEKNKIKEEMHKKWGKTVDDLKPDNPSCNMGVNQRLMQSINGNPITDRPETRPLDAAIVRNKVGELIATQFNKFIELKSASEIKELLEAFDKKYGMLESLTDKEQKLLEEFKLSSKDISEMIKEMVKSYGERFIWQEMRTDSEHYFSFEEYARKLATANPWEQTFHERLLGIAKGRLEKITKEHKELKEYKEEKEFKVPAPTVLHGFAAARREQGDKEESNPRINPGLD